MVLDECAHITRRPRSNPAAIGVALPSDTSFRQKPNAADTPCITRTNATRAYTTLLPIPLAVYSERAVDDKITNERVYKTTIRTILGTNYRISRERE